MTTYDNTNRGVLFDNDRKEQDSHPDMNGSININGVDHWFSGWWKSGAKGEFLSLSIGKPKEARNEPSQAAVQVRRGGNRPSNQQPLAPAPKHDSGFDDMPDDVPF